MTSLTSLSAEDFSRAVTTYDDLLRAQKDVINRLNVYPVPDGDTGTNMSLTMRAVVEGLNDLAPGASLGQVAAAIAKGSLMGARGNSGVILSQMLRGLTSTFPSEGVVELDQFVDGLNRADELARQAVSKPVEGTILSVARAAALGAKSDHSCLEASIRAARDAARVALARTPEQLPVLRQAGVVDSGGTGLVLWFDALCHVVAGDPLPETPALPEVSALAEPSTQLRALAELRYEVMFLLAADDGLMAAFRSSWESLGDSIVIVGGDGTYNCHIHTDDIGGALEAALQAGRPRDIRVTDLLEQSEEVAWVREAGVVASVAPVTAVVAVVVGEGVAELYSSLGVRELVVGGQTMNPSTAELVAAVNATGSSHVVILPNNKNIRAVAEQVDALVRARVRVLPTTSVVEGLSALVGYDPTASLDANVSAMSSFAAGVRTGEVTRAVRATSTLAGDVRDGDWIGLSAEGVVAIADTVVGAATSLLDHLTRDGGELLTVLTGESARGADTDVILAHCAQHYPKVTVEVHDGRQPLYPYLFGLE